MAGASWRRALLAACCCFTFTTAGARCSTRLGHALGYEWMRCVVDDLLLQQSVAEEKGVSEFFPTVPHEMDPFRPKAGEHGAGARTAETLKELLRNYTCDVADGGSQPLRTFTWKYTPKQPCPDHPDLSGVSGLFSYRPGFLPAGDDLPHLGKRMSEEEAVRACAAAAECAGFTYNAPRGGGGDKPIIFKSRADDVTAASGWHTHVKRHTDPAGCAPGAAAGGARAPRQYTVRVLRESPPVYLVDDFLSPDECAQMVNATVPKMGRSVVGGGGVSSYRQSYSVNMMPNFDDPAFTVTRWARRKFAFAREVAGYGGVEEGDGQEPINAVYYKDFGDQYRPHCDGECNGGKYSLGTRLATSLSYCVTADEGGYTVFTKSGLKVVPTAGQMLFFGYLYDGNTPGVPMDHGHTEHSGCPLRRGSKWIATMWFREGVTEEKNWEYYSRRSRGGV